MELTVVSIPKNIKNNVLFFIVSEILDKSIIKLQLIQWHLLPCLPLQELLQV